MDSIWQQHRTFILKILAGLGVCLLYLIIWSSVSGPSAAETQSLSKGLLAKVRSGRVPPEGETEAYRTAAEKLNARIHFVAKKVGELRKGEELRRGVIEELLSEFGDDTEAARDRFLELSRHSPVACVINLAGRAREYLITLAGRNSVLITEDIGYDKLQMEPAEIDRHIITLRTVVKVAEIAIRSQVREIREVSISVPSGGRFAGEKAFIREFPVRFQIRGSSASLLALIERLNDPSDLVVLKRLSEIRHEKGSEDMLTAELEVVALWIDPDAEIRE